MKPAVNRILQIVDEVARKEGYDLVIPSEMALYRVDKIDITPLVIQTLDREGPGALTGAGAVKSDPAAKNEKRENSEKSAVKSKRDAFK